MMAKAQISMPDDFLARLTRLGDKTDEIIPRVLEAGGEIMLSNVKGNLDSVVGKGTKYDSRSTGKLQSSLGLSKARLNSKGDHDIKVGFAENRKDGKSNAMLANVLEYGRHGQPPRPFLKPAKTKSKAACVDAMKAKFDSEVDAL